MGEGRVLGCDFVFIIFFAGGCRSMSMNTSGLWPGDSRFVIRDSAGKCIPFGFGFYCTWFGRRIFI